MPPRFNTPVAPWVNVPVPINEAVADRFPLLVSVTPVTVILASEAVPLNA